MYPGKTRSRTAASPPNQIKKAAPLTTTTRSTPSKHTSIFCECASCRPSPGPSPMREGPAPGDFCLPEKGRKRRRSCGAKGQRGRSGAGVLESVCVGGRRVEPVRKHGVASLDAEMPAVTMRCDRRSFDASWRSFGAATVQPLSPDLPKPLQLRPRHSMPTVCKRDVLNRALVCVRSRNSPPHAPPPSSQVLPYEKVNASCDSSLTFSATPSTTNSIIDNTQSFPEHQL